MVDDHGFAVGQAHHFAPVTPGNQVDRRRGVMDDVDARRGPSEQGAVEPLEVLAH